MKNSQLFEEFANKTTLAEIKAPLAKIGQDNKVHAEDVLQVSEKIGHKKVNPKECKRKMKPVCELTDSMLAEVRNKETVTSEELENYLALLENAGGSVNFLRTQVETFLHMTDEISQVYKTDLSEFDDKLTAVAKLVEEHVDLLEEIKEKLAQNKPKTDGLYHPFVKYQNPDDWRQPSDKKQHLTRTNITD